MRRALYIVPWVALLLGGCGNGSKPSDDGGAPTPDLAQAAGTMQLLSFDYSLTGGQEVYLCKRVTLTADVLIHALTPVNGVATHHEVLGVDPMKSSPDGSGPCDPLETTWNLLFASGVGSPSLVMPDGVALRAHAGDQLVFQLHLLNAAQTPVTSTASLDYVPMDPAMVQNEAEMILAGPPPLQGIGPPPIPVGDNQIVDGSCTMKGAVHYFAVFPHMHKLGKHIKVTTVIGGATATVFDDDYSITNQVFKSFTQLAMANGDQIKVECTYNNTTGMPVPFGTSSTQEMCFAISYRYPKLPASQTGPICFR